jgi:hypothetical protein
MKKLCSEDRDRSTTHPHRLSLPRELKDTTQLSTYTWNAAIAAFRSFIDPDKWNNCPSEYSLPCLPHDENVLNLKRRQSAKTSWHAAGLNFSSGAVETGRPV